MRGWLDDFCKSETLQYIYIFKIRMKSIVLKDSQ